MVHASHPVPPPLSSVPLCHPPLPCRRFEQLSLSPIHRLSSVALVSIDSSRLCRAWPLWNGTMRPPAPPPHADVPRGHTRGARNIIVTQLSIVSGVKWRREPRILLMIVVPALRNLNRTGLDSSLTLCFSVFFFFVFFLSLSIFCIFFFFSFFRFYGGKREWKLVEQESCNLNIRRRLTC